MITMTPVKSNWRPVSTTASRGTLIPERALPGIQLAAGVLGMVGDSAYFRVPDALRGPDRGDFSWGRPAIQAAFTLFVLAETRLPPSKATWWTASVRSGCCAGRGPGRLCLGAQRVGGNAARGFTSRPWSAGSARDRLRYEHRQSGAEVVPHRRGSPPCHGRRVVCAPGPHWCCRSATLPGDRGF